MVSFEERAAGSLRSRHAAGAMRHATRIQEAISLILRDLSAGRLPREDMHTDAVALARHVAALEAMDELAEIHAAPEPQQRPQPLLFDGGEALVSHLTHHGRYSCDEAAELVAGVKEGGVFTVFLRDGAARPATHLPGGWFIILPAVF